MVLEREIASAPEVANGRPSKTRIIDLAEAGHGRSLVKVLDRINQLTGLCIRDKGLTAVIVAEGGLDRAHESKAQAERVRETPDVANVILEMMPNSGGVKRCTGRFSGSVR